MTNFEYILEQVEEILGKELINYHLTILNKPIILLKATSLCLSKTDYEKIRNLNYDFDWICINCLALPKLNIYHNNSNICFEIIQPPIDGYYMLALYPVLKH